MDDKQRELKQLQLRRFELIRDISRLRKQLAIIDGQIDKLKKHE